MYALLDNDCIIGRFSQLSLALILAELRSKRTGREIIIVKEEEQ